MVIPCAICCYTGCCKVEHPPPATFTMTFYSGTGSGCEPPDGTDDLVTCWNGVMVTLTYNAMTACWEYSGALSTIFVCAPYASGPNSLCYCDTGLAIYNVNTADQTIFFSLCCTSYPYAWVLTVTLSVTSGTSCLGCSCTRVYGPGLENACSCNAAGYCTATGTAVCHPFEISFGLSLNGSSMTWDSCASCTQSGDSVTLVCFPLFTEVFVAGGICEQACVVISE